MKSTCNKLQSSKNNLTNDIDINKIIFNLDRNALTSKLSFFILRWM